MEAEQEKKRLNSLATKTHLGLKLRFHPCSWLINRLWNIKFKTESTTASAVYLRYDIYHPGTETCGSKWLCSYKFWVKVRVSQIWLNSLEAPFRDIFLVVIDQCIKETFHLYTTWIMPWHLHRKRNSGTEINRCKLQRFCTQVCKTYMYLQVAIWKSLYNYSFCHHKH